MEPPAASCSAGLDPPKSVLDAVLVFCTPNALLDGCIVEPPLPKSEVDPPEFGCPPPPNRPVVPMGALLCPEFAFAFVGAFELPKMLVLFPVVGV